MPNYQNTKSKKGFTIIEVVLVLAVAGLIFLMVFIALPALQRTQRDTQRRQDMSRVSSALTQYQTNNSTKANNLPASGAFTPGTTTGFTDCSGSACTFVRDYLNEANATENLFVDPDGEAYAVYISTNVATDSNGVAAANKSVTNNGKTATISDGTVSGDFAAHVIFIVPGAKCNGEQAEKSQKRHFAILMKLEGASVACLDNQ